MSNTAEEVMEKAGTNQHTGSYGNTKGKSANSLYKSYKTFVTDRGQKPLDFTPWLKWAKAKGIVPANVSEKEEFKADAENNNTNVTTDSIPTWKIAVGVVLVVGIGVAIYMNYKKPS